MVNLHHGYVARHIQIRDALKDTFRTGISRPLAWRKQQLYQLARLLQENGDAISQSLFDDFKKPRMEVYFAEIAPLMTRCIESASKLEEWTKPEVIASKASAFRPTVYRTPKGVALIIASVYYQIYLVSRLITKRIQALELSRHAISSTAHRSHQCGLLCRR